MPHSIEKPVPDSHFRLLPCAVCQSQEVGYQARTASGKAKFRVRCAGCGKKTTWWPCKHDAQMDWNRISRTRGKHYEHVT